MKKKVPHKKPSRAAVPLRFARPDFGPGGSYSIDEFGPEMLSFIQGRLAPIPAPRRSPPNFQLSDIIGQPSTAEIEASGVLMFHTVGDTGLPAQATESPQEWVAAAMTGDFDLSRPAGSPAFFFHLGDVIYGPHKDPNYRIQFYEPYRNYPGKIIAIPGNHDGETFAQTDPVTLKAFQNYFCAAKAVVPLVAGSIFRQTMIQPGPYWFFDTPFIQIVGLYSNTAENPGFISGSIPGPSQKNWLISTLKAVAKTRLSGERKALAFATHHPPFSSGGHAGSSAMLAEIDSVCRAAGIFPDIFFSGHAHSYQRYTRFLTEPNAPQETPFLVVGCGGHGDQAVLPATGMRTGDHRFDASYQGHGYALVSVTKTTIKVDFYSVNQNVRTLKDSMLLDLTTQTIQPE